MKTIGQTIKSLWSLIVGLKITTVEFCKPQITVHFPRKEVTNLGSYRGHIDLVPLANDPQTPRCIMCGYCADTCPSGCISLKFHMVGEEVNPEQRRRLLLGLDVAVPRSGGKTPPPDKIERVLDGFHLNYNYCSLCGLCVQGCPVGSLAFSRDSYLVGRARQDFEFDLLARLKSRAGTNSGKAAA
ncbi:MAG: 4Fe-4S dicluster domain-containing protein [Desulfarculus sp.]|nr:4Fe-4S dicluster domain-containing protein [Desulfarculus sp.]